MVLGDKKPVNPSEGHHHHLKVTLVDICYTKIVAGVSKF